MKVDFTFYQEQYLGHLPQTLFSRFALRAEAFLRFACGESWWEQSGEQAAKMALCAVAEEMEKLFRKEVGVSVGQYIDDQLMRTAQERLDQTNDSIAKISQSLGFADSYYFSRRFKQLCGITPLRYRRLRRLHYIKPLNH